MPKILVFSDTNATWVKVEDTTPYVGLDNVAIEPDLTNISHVKLHHLKLVDGKVVEMSADEKAARDELHKTPQINPRTIEVVRTQIKEVPVQVEKIVEVERVVRVIPAWVHIAYAMVIGAAMAVKHLIK